MKYSFSFPRIFNPATGKTSLYTGQKSVESCMRLLLLTIRGELLGDPNFGSGLSNNLFEPNIDLLGDILREEIADSLNKYEKRVVVYENDISFSRDENTMYLNVVYYRRDTGEVNEISLELFEENK